MKKIFATNLVMILSIAAISAIPPCSSVTAGGGENDKHRDKHGKGNICGCLVAKNEKLNKVVNDETLTDEQLVLLRICAYSWYINCIV